MDIGDLTVTWYIAYNDYDIGLCGEPYKYPRVAMPNGERDLESDVLPKWFDLIWINS